MSSAQTPGAPRPLPPGPTIVLAATVATLVIVVIRPFVVPVLWALLLAYVTWPVYRWLMRRWRRRAGFAAFALTVGVAAAIVAPMIAIVSLAHEEVIDAYRTAVRSAAANQDEIVAAVRAIPWIGPSLAEYWHNVAPDSPVARAYADLLAQRWPDVLAALLGRAGHNVIKLLLALLTLFFLYRDGSLLAQQMRAVITGFYGSRLEPYFEAARRTVHAVVYGFVLTALLQGATAGLGYWIFGVGAPIALGLLTAAAALVPLVGTILVLGPAVGWLLATNQFWPAIGLLAWGVVIVHPIDNLIRPLVIGARSGMPFLLVVFGVAGGIAAFGLVGLFVGPIAIAIAVAIWREWLELAAASDRGTAG